MTRQLVLVTSLINIYTVLCGQERPIVLDIAKDHNPGVTRNKKILSSGMPVVIFEPKGDQPIKKIVSDTILVWGGFSNVNNCTSACVYLEKEERRALEITFTDINGIEQTEKFIYINNGWLDGADDLFENTIKEIKVPARKPKKRNDEDAGAISRSIALILFPLFIATYLNMQ